MSQLVKKFQDITHCIPQNIWRYGDILTWIFQNNFVKILCILYAKHWGKDFVSNWRLTIIWNNVDSKILYVVISLPLMNRRNLIFNIGCQLSNSCLLYIQDTELGIIGHANITETAMPSFVIGRHSTDLKVKYHKVSNIRRAKSQNSNVFRLGLQLSLRNILKPSVKWRMEM